MKKIAPILAAIISTGLSYGATGVVESTGQFQINSSTSYLSSVGALGNTRLDGYNFGTFDISAGNSLWLSNWFFENYAYNGGLGNNWLDGSSTATLNLSISSVTNNQTLTQVGVSGNNRTWNNSPDSINLLSGLSNGVYTLVTSVTYTFNEWTGTTNVLTSSNNGVATSTFTVVPEPTSALLGAISTLFLLRRRR